MNENLTADVRTALADTGMIELATATFDLYRRFGFGDAKKYLQLQMRLIDEVDRQLHEDEERPDDEF